MQFFNSHDQITFEQFQDLLPLEAKLISQCLDLRVDIIVEDSKIALRYDKYNPISIDIDNELLHHKRYFYKNSPYKELIAKAIGLKKGNTDISVLDATGGMLGDTLLIYALGIQRLKTVERHPLVAALILNAIANSSQELNFEFISSFDLPEIFDVIYFDPMYSDKNKKTAPKKEMLIFREIIGEDTDALEVAKTLLSQANKRLVIKRSSKAPPLLESPDLQFQGKSTRYDVYLKQI